VLILDYMSALALQHSGFTVLTPVYGSNEAPPSDTVKGGEDEDDVVDTVEDEVMDDDDSLTSINDPFSSITSSAPLPPPPSTIDPSQWSLEYEQAAPLLRAHPTSLSTQEWRAHHDSSIKHQSILLSSLDSTRTELDRLSSLLHSATERVTVKEKYLNKEYEGLVEEMRGMQGEVEGLGVEYGKLSEDLSRMGKRLKECGDEVDGMKESIGRKNERMSDTTPVRAVSAAVKELRKEVVEMEVRIGIMSQSVSAMRQRRQREKEREKGQQERERTRKGNGKSVRMEKPREAASYHY
jgi:uncharacterized protein YoxC